MCHWISHKYSYNLEIFEGLSLELTGLGSERDGPSSGDALVDREGLGARPPQPQSADGGCLLAEHGNGQAGGQKLEKSKERRIVNQE